MPRFVHGDDHVGGGDVDEDDGGGDGYIDGDDALIWIYFTSWSKNTNTTGYNHGHIRFETACFFEN